MVSYRNRRIMVPLSLGLVLALLLSSTLFVNAGGWEHTSHGPEGGVIQALAVDSVGTLYAGTYRGWVFKGTFPSGELQWAMKKDGLTGGMAQRDIQCVTTNGTDVYIGTNGAGVFTSTTSSNWGHVTDQDLSSKVVHSLLIDSDILYAGTAAGVCTRTVSASGDLVWSKMTTTLLCARALVIVDGTLYAGCKNNLIKWGVHYWDGASWQAMNGGLPTNVSVHALVAYSNVLYAGTDGHGVYECNTAVTTTWTAKSTGLSDDALDVRSLALDGSTLYAGTEAGVYRWNAGESEWEARSTGLEPDNDDSNAHRIRTLLCTGSQELYAGTPGRGVFYTANGGGSWSTANGEPTDNLLSAHVIRAVAVNPAYDWKIYAGTEGGGIHRSKDGGIYWNRRSAGLDDRTTFALAVTHPSGFPVYAGTNDGIFTTTNGITWTMASNGLPDALSRDVRALAIDPVSATVVYAGTGNGVYTTTNSGAEWVPNRVNPGGGSDFYIYSLAIDPVSPTIVYAGTETDGVWRSTDGGGNWTEFNEGDLSNSAAVRALTVDSERTVYAGTTDNGLYKRTITGTWRSDWGAGQSVYALIVNPITPTIVLAGTKNFGVQVYGPPKYVTWTGLLTGLQNLHVYALAIDDYVTQTMHAGTSGSGVWDYTWGDEPPPPPEMGVSKSDGRTEISLGQYITYTIQYANDGEEIATGVVITDAIPNHTEYVSSDPTFTHVTGPTYTLSVGQVISGSSDTATLVVRVFTTTAGAPEFLANSVYIQDDGSHGPDPREDNNVDHDITYLRWVDLQVSKTDGLTQVGPGDVVTYTITYTNVGRTAADNVVLTETLSSQAAYVGGGWDLVSGNQYTKDVGTVSGGGGTGSATFVVRVNDAPTEETLVNQVEIGYDEAHGPDITPGDNTAQDETSIYVPPPDLAVTKTDGTYYVMPGDTVTYTITYTNSQAHEARDIVITETIPADTTIQNGADWHLVSGRTYTRTVSDLPAGETGSVSISVQVDETASAGPITNTVFIRAAGEVNLDDNEATDVDEVLTEAPDLKFTYFSDGVTATTLCHTLEYTLRYINEGNKTATGVAITATLPPSATYVGGGWTALGDNQYRKTIGSMAVGADGQATLSLVLTNTSAALELTSDRPATSDRTSETAWPDTFIVQVVIGCVEPENRGNNTATDTDTLRRPDLAVIGISTSPIQPSKDQPATIYVTLANEGDAEVALPGCCNGFNYDLYVNPGHAPQAGEYSNVNVYDWLGSLSPGETRIVQFTYTFTATGDHDLYAQANADRYSLIPEVTYDNNTFGPFKVTVVEAGPPKIYLPLITKSYTY